MPYLFFLYMFISTWILLMNKDSIERNSSSKRVYFGFISTTVAIFAFVGVATLYHVEHQNEDYKELIHLLY